jgi:hypothetical protein
MSAPFLLREEDVQAIRRVAIRARSKAIPWTKLREHVSINQDTDTLTLADRHGERPMAHDIDGVELPFGYRCAISYEHQPAGLCLHISMSGPAKGRLPNPLAMAMVFEALGHKVEKLQGRTWAEEFEPGHHALNVVVVVEKQDRPPS